MYQIPELLKIPGIVHAFSTKEDGNMANFILNEKQDESVVLNNRKGFLKRTGVNIERAICMSVEHGNKVKKADPALEGKSMTDYKFAEECDGLITDSRNTYLFLLTADCIPVIFYEPEKKILGLMHYGWKNADLNTSGVFMQKLVSEFSITPERMIVAIGPSARKESYIHENPQQKNDPKWRDYLELVENGRYKIDLVGLCKLQLQRASVPVRNIIDCGIDTIRDERFFSHYRSVRTHKVDEGRLACVVGLK